MLRATLASSSVVISKIGALGCICVCLVSVWMRAWARCRPHSRVVRVAVTAELTRLTRICSRCSECRKIADNLNFKSRPSSPITFLHCTIYTVRSTQVRYDIPYENTVSRPPLAPLRPGRFFFRLFFPPRLFGLALYGSPASYGGASLVATSHPTAAAARQSFAICCCCCCFMYRACCAVNSSICLQLLLRRLLLLCLLDCCCASAALPHMPRLFTQ